MRIIRTVLPLMVGVVALALCDIAQAVNQSFSPALWFVAQPASVSTKATGRILEIFLFDSIRIVRFGSITPTPHSRKVRGISALHCYATLSFAILISTRAARLQGEGRSFKSDFAPFVPEPGQNIHFPIVEEKQAKVEIVGLVNVPFWSALVSTINQ